MIKSKNLDDKKIINEINSSIKKIKELEKKAYIKLNKEIETLPKILELKKSLNFKIKKNKMVYSFQINELLYNTKMKNGKTIIDNFLISPPKSALLKMTEVKKLAKLRKEKNFTEKDFIYVVEPQQYLKVTKLTPKNMMFEKADSKDYGYFTTGNSGIAHSGDGGDHGDKWWKANESLLKYLQNKINNLKKLI